MQDEASSSQPALPIISNLTNFRKHIQEPLHVCSWSWKAPRIETVGFLPQSSGVRRHIITWASAFHWIIETFRFKRPPRSPSPTPAHPHHAHWPSVPHLHSSWTSPGTMTPPPSWFQSLTAVAEKKLFLIANLPLSWHYLRPFPLILSLLPDFRGWPPFHPHLLSGSCREQWGLPWASSSPDWPTPAPSAAPQRTDCRKIQYPEF
mgnify:CR=1 FL=1